MENWSVRPEDAWRMAKMRTGMAITLLKPSRCRDQIWRHPLLERCQGTPPSGHTIAGSCLYSRDDVFRHVRMEREKEEKKKRNRKKRWSN